MFETEWKGRKLIVKGDWTARWLFLCPDYELWLDDEKLDRSGGPVLQPKLEAVIEDEDGELHHITAHLVSILGFKPTCELEIEGEAYDSGVVRVENFLNPFLVITILASVIVMLMVGPEVLARYMP
jgi:hypothetical protein